MAKVHISCSRRDTEYTRRLTAELKKNNLDFWIDWEGMPPTVDGWHEVERGIEETDSFLFQSSPDSANFRICSGEIDRAIKIGRHLIPLIVRNIPPEAAYLQLRQLNPIFFGKSDDFDAGLKKLLTAIHTGHIRVLIKSELQGKALYGIGITARRACS